MLSRRVLFFSILLVVVTVVFSTVALAATPNSPRTIEALYTVICRLANWFFGFVMVAAVVAFLYAGFLFFGSGESSEKVTKAKKFFGYALLGTAIAVLAKSLVLVIGSAFDATNIKDFFTCASLQVNEVKKP